MGMVFMNKIRTRGHAVLMLQQERARDGRLSCDRTQQVSTSRVGADFCPQHRDSWVPVQHGGEESPMPTGLLGVRYLRAGGVRHEAGRENESLERQRRIMHLCAGTVLTRTEHLGDTQANKD